MGIDFTELAAPFEFKDLKWRSLRVQDYGKLEVMIAPYVTARAIQDRLDNTCLQENWWNEFKTWNKGQLCGITIRTEEGNVTKWDGAPDTQIEGLKGGLSDSMKRAAVHWGIGRYLYYLPPMKGRVLQGYEFGAYKGTNPSDKKPFWWKPNAAAIKATKAVSEGK